MYFLKRHSYLLLLAVICFAATFFAKHYSISNSNNYSVITRNINDRVNDAITEANAQFNALVDIESDALADLNFKGLKYNTYGYRNGKLIYWSDTEFVPEFRNIRGSYELKFIRTVRDDFLALKRTLKGIEWVVTIPIHHDYKIENKYFTSAFNQNLFSGQAIRIINCNSSEYIVGYEGTCYFGLEFSDEFESDNTSLTGFALVCFILGFFLSVTLISKYAFYLSKSKFTYGVMAILSLSFLLRYFLLEAAWPNDIINHPLFDSRIFASSLMNASFADLFINLIILLVISHFLFRRWIKSVNYRSSIDLAGIKKSLAIILYLGLFILLFHWIFLLFQTIYHNSQVSFDVNNSIEFDATRVSAYLAYLLFATCIILLTHSSYRSARHLSKSKRELFAYYLLTLGLFSIINYAIDQAFLASVTIATILFIALITSGLGRAFGRLNYASFLYLFLLFISISWLGSWAIFDFENEREIEKKKKYANQFLVGNDAMAEYLLSVINDKIKNDLFIQSTLASPFLSKDAVISKIRQVYLNNYFDKYDIDILVYDISKNPLKEPINQGDKKFALDVNKFTTGYNGIYFINLPELGATKRYLNYLEIKRRGLKVGYVVIDMQLKRIVPGNVYPEMLVDNRFLSPYQNANYSYAVFEDNEVVYSSGQFNYEDGFISNTNYLTNESFDFRDYRHVALNDQAGHRVVISSTDHPLTDVISNFSILFLLKVILLLVGIIIYALYSWYSRAELTYTARIQLYLNGAFFLPLFAVSLTTLSLINATFEKELFDDYYQKAESIGNNLNTVLGDFIQGVTNEDELKETISNISRFASSDINLFGKDGKLIATNQPAIYDNQLLSEYLSPEAYSRIIQSGEKSFTSKEKVGALSFNASYFGVKSFATGELIGVVSIPFFDSEYALEKSQILVITNIINVFVFVFIAFLILSYFATEWLTFPLVFITQKLKKTSLTEFNEPLNWNTNDEIGLMVGEYNRMLINLEDSKRALARSEKQSAWREIARQVAHEIKNPLTPMKLTLQHLSRRLAENDNDPERLKPVKSLLKQIDTLDDIASSFSSFAQMPIPESEKYELTSVIKDVVNLHLANQKSTIHLHLPEEKVYTLGDKKLMGRIIANLILNAIQSASAQEVELTIGLKVSDSKLLMSFKDNGDGIPEEFKQKIFIPNFTTKDTGSGIGLAIAKHGVEHAGGKIWYETEEKIGTTFFIELLIVEE